MMPFLDMFAYKRDCFLRLLFHGVENNLCTNDLDSRGLSEHAVSMWLPAGIHIVYLVQSIIQYDIIDDFLQMNILYEQC